MTERHGGENQENREPLEVHISRFEQVGLQPGDRLERKEKRIVPADELEVISVQLNTEDESGGKIVFNAKPYDFMEHTQEHSFAELARDRAKYRVVQRYADFIRPDTATIARPERKEVERRQREREEVVQLWQQFRILDIRAGDVLKSKQGTELVVEEITYARHASACSIRFKGERSGLTRIGNVLLFSDIVTFPEWLDDVERKNR